MHKDEMIVCSSVAVIGAIVTTTAHKTVPYLGRAIIYVGQALAHGNPTGINNTALVGLIGAIQAGAALAFMFLRQKKSGSYEENINNLIKGNVITTGALVGLTALAVKTNLIASKVSLLGSLFLLLSSASSFFIAKSIAARLDDD